MDQLIERLEKIAQTMVDDGRLFGATVGVVNFKGQKEIASVGKVGTGHFANELLPVNHIYDLASLTKLYTTMRFIQLFKAGQVTPNATVKSILPDYGNDRVTVSQLLLHNAGLPSSVRQVPALTKSMLETDIMAGELINEPGRVTKYSDVGFMLLGKVLTAVTGLPLVTDMTANLLTPKKLTASGYRVPGIGGLQAPTSRFVPTEDVPVRGGILQGQVDDFKAYLLGGAAGHAGMFATASDALSFVHEWLLPDDDLPANMAGYLAENQAGIRTFGWHFWTYGGEDNPVVVTDWLYQTGFTGTIMAVNYRTMQGLVVLTNRVHPSRDNTSWLKDRYEFTQAFFDQV